MLSDIVRKYCEAALPIQCTYLHRWPVPYRRPTLQLLDHMVCKTLPCTTTKKKGERKQKRSKKKRKEQTCKKNKAAKKHIPKKLPSQMFHEMFGKLKCATIANSNTCNKKIQQVTAQCSPRLMWNENSKWQGLRHLPFPLRKTTGPRPYQSRITVLADVNSNDSNAKPNIGDAFGTTRLVIEIRRTLDIHTCMHTSHHIT